MERNNLQENIDILVKDLMIVVWKRTVLASS